METKTHAILPKLLTQDMERVSLYPIQHPILWQEYQRQQAHHWTIADIPAATVKSKWPQWLHDTFALWGHTSANVKSCGSGGINPDVATDWTLEQSITDWFLQHVRLPEARHCFVQQQLSESKRSDACSFVLSASCADHQSTEQHKRTLQALDQSEEAQGICGWNLQWFFGIPETGANSPTLCDRLAALVCLKGMMYVSRHWLMQQGTQEKKSPLQYVETKLFVDRQLQAECACQLYHHYGCVGADAARHAQRVKTMMREAMELEHRWLKKNCAAVILDKGVAHLESLSVRWLQRMQNGVEMEVVIVDKRANSFALDADF